ncbi:MAG: phosphotransferase, partial [Desulfamplus sp.]|nr:phosphotransferase [Desulfamplus sp.]
ALDGAFQGLMHRDMQSRNIMVKGGENLLKKPNLSTNEKYLKDENFFFIDFQSARRGPLQYDLASLLIDPYVNLADNIKETILYECINELNNRLKLINKDTCIKNRWTDNYEHNPEKFIKCFRYCSLTRNMQMLGAFANLSINKGKNFFKQYIPIAVENLKKNINHVDKNRITRLYSCITKL